MTMAKLRIKMIPARIIREKGKEVAVTPGRGVNSPRERLPGKNRIAAVFLPATVFAFETGPDSIELVHGSFYESRLISQDSGFKIAGSCAFHSYPSSSKVSRSDIGNLGIEDNDLEVNTWA